MSENEHEDEVQDKVMPVDRQTIRDTIAAQAQARFQEQANLERADRHRSRDERLKKRRANELKSARTHKANNLRVANESNRSVRSHVAAAARELQAALRDASNVSMPRHSEEGRRQQRDIRSIRDAVGALRRIGAGDFDETDFEVDLDLDVG